MSDRSAAVRLDSRISDTWEVEDGIGQRAVLSGFLFFSDFSACMMEVL